MFAFYWYLLFTCSCTMNIFFLVPFLFFQINHFLAPSLTLFSLLHFPFTQHLFIPKLSARNVLLFSIPSYILQILPISSFSWISSHPFQNHPSSCCSLGYSLGHLYSCHPELTSHPYPGNSFPSSPEWDLCYLVPVSYSFLFYSL